MDLAKFEQDVRAFLDTHAKPLPHEELVWGEGSDVVGSQEALDPDEEWQMLREARAWRALEYEQGFGWLTGPQEYGGAGLPVEYERRYRELRSQYDVGSQRPFVISLGMVAPTILAHGSEEARDAYLRKLYAGELIGCQLFSEPGAGSDLASVSTRAVRDGDEWVLRGQKVWTSGAQYADIGEVLCRTNPDAPKHAGLTAFVVDMSAPGVEVRPLRTMTGSAPFNEVFFDEVRVPDALRLGAVDDGWRVAITTLMSERALGASPGTFGIEEALRMLIELLRHEGRSDPRLRQVVMRAYIAAKTVEWNGHRSDARRRAGLPPGPEESIFKLSSTEVVRLISNAASQILGPSLTADTGAWGTYSWASYVLGVPGMRIAAGTDEIMRNILGERVLGLPKGPASG